MRRARHKSTESAFYHVITRVAGSPNYYPLQKREARRKLLDLLYVYTRVYCCVLVSFEIMGSHYHFIVWMRKFCRLTREELRRRAYLLWGEKAGRRTGGWTEEGWERFNRKLFDLSALMQHVNGEYAKWHNQRYGRRGHFWGDRFKNLELLDRAALQRCLLYIETNATRAQLVKHPEQWRASSAWRRAQGLAEGLMPIEKIFADVPAEQAFETYRERLEQRRREDEEKARQGESGRQRFFSDGIAVGSQAEVARVLEEYRRKGLYQRRKNPIPQLSGELYTLREQRSHAWS